MSSSIQFNDRSITVNPEPSSKYKMAHIKSGEIVVYYGSNGASFVFKSIDGSLVTNFTGYRYAYQNGHFHGRHGFLNALKKLGVVTAAEIKKYEGDQEEKNLKHAKRCFAKQLEEAAKDAKFKLTKAQKKLIEEYKN